jgi:VIT1/CCC1 family predicted Fe2+/Mn2+ transporter
MIYIISSVVFLLIAILFWVISVRYEHAFDKWAVRTASLSWAAASAVTLYIYFTLQTIDYLSLVKPFTLTINL